MNKLFFLTSVTIISVCSVFPVTLHAQIQEGDVVSLWTPTGIDYEPLISKPQYLIDAICKLFCRNWQQIKQP